MWLWAYPDGCGGVWTTGATGAGPTLAAVRRAPGTPSAGPSLAGLGVILLAVVVLGGTAFGYAQWRAEIDRATDGTFPTPATSERTPLPSAPTSGTDAKEPDAVESEDVVGSDEPTFGLLKPSASRPQPVVLLVGDGYADGRGASSAGTAYASLLARDLGWDVRLATAAGAGYLSPSPTLLELFTSSPAALDPDLVVVQGAYGTNGSNEEAKTAVGELDAAIRARFGDVPVVVVTAFADQVTDQVETRERTVARAWREDADVLVLRPQLEGWAAAGTDDAGHRLIADQLEDAFRATGLAKPA